MSTAQRSIAERRAAHSMSVLSATLWQPGGCAAKLSHSGDLEVQRRASKVRSVVSVSAQGE